MSTVSGDLSQGQGRCLFLSALLESPHGTAQTLTHRLLHAADWKMLKPNPQFMSDKGYASGNTSDFARKNLKVLDASGGGLNCWGSIETIPLILHKAIGAETLAALNTPTRYSHSAALADTPNFVGGCTIEEHRLGLVANAERDHKFLGMAMDEVSISWDNDSGFAVVAFNTVGTGAVSAATMVADAANVPEIFLLHSKIRTSFQALAANGTPKWNGLPDLSAVTAGAFVTIDSGATDISHLLSKGRITLRNGLDSGRRGGVSADAGRYGGQPFARNRSVEVELDFMQDDTWEAILDYYGDQTSAAQKEVSLIFDFAGHTLTGTGGQIAIPVAALLAQVDEGTGVGVLDTTARFEARKPTAQGDSGISDPAILYSYFVNSENYDYA
jgi:hypothetical protein